MDIAHGKRTTRLYHEHENEFERQLQSFRQKATEFYGRPAPQKENDADRLKREKIRKEDFAHLEREARFLSMMGGLYARV